MWPQIDNGLYGLGRCGRSGCHQQTQRGHPLRRVSGLHWLGTASECSCPTPPPRVLALGSRGLLLCSCVTLATLMTSLFPLETTNQARRRGCGDTDQEKRCQCSAAGPREGTVTRMVSEVLRRSHCRHRAWGRALQAEGTASAIARALESVATGRPQADYLASLRLGFVTCKVGVRAASVAGRMASDTPGCIAPATNLWPFGTL